MRGTTDSAESTATATDAADPGAATANTGTPAAANTLNPVWLR